MSGTPIAAAITTLVESVGLESTWCLMFQVMAQIHTAGNS